MRKRLMKAFLTASMISIFCVVPVRGREYDHKIIENERICDTNQKSAKIYTRYTTAQLNIRKEPNAESKIVGVLNYNQKVKIQKCSKDWVILLNNSKKLGYVNKKYLSKKKQKSTTYRIPEYSGYKSFMDFQKITDESSPQWVLQQEYSYTGDYGIRMVDGRYCVAIGFAFDPKIGQYFDLILENGTMIPCIISDEKKSEDTIDDMYTAANGCYIEFVIDIDSLDKSAAISGDISDLCEEWDSPVKKINIYKKNVLED